MNCSDRLHEKILKRISGMRVTRPTVYTELAIEMLCQEVDRVDAENSTLRQQLERTGVVLAPNVVDDTPAQAPSLFCGLCDACTMNRIGCPCDGAYDDGCFVCAPERHARPPCPPKQASAVVQSEVAPLPVHAIQAHAGALSIGTVLSTSQLPATAGDRVSFPTPTLDSVLDTQRQQELFALCNRMDKVAGQIWNQAVPIGVHAFIEWCGLAGEFVKICRHSASNGVDFTMANAHTGKPLVMETFHAKYLAEKFECIFGATFRSHPDLWKIFTDAVVGTETDEP